MLQQNVDQSLYCKELRVSSKISVLPSETFSETLGLEHFTTASRSHCEQNSSSSSAVAELYPREAVVLATALRDCLSQVWMDRPAFWHGYSFLPILQCVVRKSSRYLHLWNSVLSSGLVLRFVPAVRKPKIGL